MSYNTLWHSSVPSFCSDLFWGDKFYSSRWITWTLDSCRSAVCVCVCHGWWPSHVEVTWWWEQRNIHEIMPTKTKQIMIPSIAKFDLMRGISTAQPCRFQSMHDWIPSKGQNLCNTKLVFLLRASLSLQTIYNYLQLPLHFMIRGFVLEFGGATFGSMLHFWRMIIATYSISTSSWDLTYFFCENHPLKITWSCKSNCLHSMFM